MKTMPPHSNQLFCVSGSDYPEVLELVIVTALSAFGPVSGWTVHERHGLMLHRGGDHNKHVRPLPSATTEAEFVTALWRQYKASEARERFIELAMAEDRGPDHRRDGSWSEGWMVHNNFITDPKRSPGDWSAAFAICPYWCYYAK